MEVCYSTLVTTMDTLWFHQLIVFSQPTTTRFALCSSTIVRGCTEASHLIEDDFTSSSSSSSSSTSQDDYSPEYEEKTLDHAQRSRPTGLTRVSNKSRSQSSSPSIHRRPRKSSIHSNGKGHKLQKISSSKTMHDLEQLELKGFRDLGFHFQKELLSPRTMNVIPGLQRLEENTTCDQSLDHNDNITSVSSTMFDDKKLDEENNNVVVGPYLSDAWLVRKPNSPLLRLKMARVSNAQDMKNCLMLWARTVASSLPL